MGYLELKESHDKLLDLWQRDFKRAFLFATIAKENGLDLDYVFEMDAEALTVELAKRMTNKPVIKIDGDLKPWTPPDDWRSGA